MVIAAAAASKSTYPAAGRTGGRQVQTRVKQWSRRCALLVQPSHPSMRRHAGVSYGGSITCRQFNGKPWLQCSLCVNIKCGLETSHVPQAYIQNRPWDHLFHRRCPCGQSKSATAMPCPGKVGYCGTRADVDASPI